MYLSNIPIKVENNLFINNNIHKQMENKLK